MGGKPVLGPLGESVDEGFEHITGARLDGLVVMVLREKKQDKKLMANVGKRRRGLYAGQWRARARLKKLAAKLEADKAAVERVKQKRKEKRLAARDAMHELWLKG